jgi:hypothetical protein
MDGRVRPYFDGGNMSGVHSIEGDIDGSQCPTRFVARWARRHSASGSIVCHLHFLIGGGAVIDGADCSIPIDANGILSIDACTSLHCVDRRPARTNANELALLWCPTDGGTSQMTRPGSSTVTDLRASAT